MNKKGLHGVSDGVYIFTETNDDNVFEFYRKDGQVLCGVKDEPMEMYKMYIVERIISGNIKKKVINSIELYNSTDGKCIRIVTSAVLKQDPLVEEVEQNETGVKKLVKSLFPKKR